TDTDLGKLIIMHEVIPSTLGECTGLCDRHGKLIFEGDILKIPYSSDLYLVKHDDKNGGWLLVEPISNAEDEFRGCDVKDFEVIGNLHDTPELLKGACDETQENRD
ncbi:MAG: YopX family protein, partial [Ruminococcus sp.]|nr:YopX family protein [Ruminococcus sp.]